MLPYMYVRTHVNYPLLLSDFNENSISFPDRFSKNTRMSYLTKIRPVGNELFHVDGRTDKQTDGYGEANSHFSQFNERT
jgi:hypothetical protein